jgi:sporulation protein YlmC with PRC-barrel domain
MFMAKAAQPSAVMSARRILGAKVYDLQGHKIGRVEDVGLDEESQSILFATVECGGFLGLGTTHHPVPWNDLDYDPSQGRYVARLTKKELQTPAYD